MTPSPPADESSSPDARRLREHVERLRTRPCADCGRSVCGHEALFDVALGAHEAPRCLACLAASLRRDATDLRDGLFEHVRRRDCFGAVWAEETRREGGEPDRRPSCLWPDDASRPAFDASPAAPPSVESSEAPPAATQFWDAGDLGCGDLVLRLRGRLREMLPGSVLELIARDPGAPADLPAWCALTGHSLVAQRHPRYWIRRKET